MMIFMFLFSHHALHRLCKTIHLSATHVLQTVTKQAQHKAVLTYALLLKLLSLLSRKKKTSTSSNNILTCNAKKKKLCTVEYINSRAARVSM